MAKKIARRNEFVFSLGQSKFLPKELIWENNEYVLFEDMEKTINHILSVDLVFKEDYPIETKPLYDNSNNNLYDYDDSYGLWEDTMNECYHCGKIVNDGNLNNELVWGHCPHCFTALVDTAEDF